MVGELGASGRGASICESNLFFELDRAAECENCGMVTARLARLCSCSDRRCPGLGIAARPEARAMEVCMHRRKGEVCMTTRCLRFRFDWSFSSREGCEGISASRLAIRTPSVRHCVQPP